MTHSSTGAVTRSSDRVPPSPPGRTSRRTYPACSRRTIRRHRVVVGSGETPWARASRASSRRTSPSEAVVPWDASSIARTTRGSIGIAGPPRTRATPPAGRKRGPSTP
ncbi:MAG: hypothetical protein WBE40_09165, partial [Thermoplasmata archaeon]